MTAASFTKNSTTGLWEATQTISKMCDIHVELSKDDQQERKHISVMWKGNAADPDFVYVENGTAYGRIGVQIKSEFYPVVVKVVAGAQPEYARLTEHS